MSYADRSSDVGGVVVLGLGVVLAGLHVWHAARPGETLLTIGTGVVVPFAASASLVAAGAWLLADDPEGDPRRIAGWTLLGTAALTCIGGLTVLSQNANGSPVAEPLFLGVSGASIGGVVGLVVGVYDARQRRARRRTVRQRRRADRQRRRAERLTRRLSVLNRVLRHDIRNGADAIRGYAELIERRPDDAERFVETIHDRADDLVAIGEDARAAEELLRGDPEEEVLDLATTVETAVDRVRRRHPAVTVTVEASPVPVCAHPALDVAVEELIEGAVDPGTAPTVTVDCRPREDRAELSVAVADGALSPSVAVVDRGYETPTDHADGLDLWLAAWIVEESGGRVDLVEGAADAGAAADPADTVDTADAPGSPGVPGAPGPDAAVVVSLSTAPPADDPAAVDDPAGDAGPPGARSTDCDPGRDDSPDHPSDATGEATDVDADPTGAAETGADAADPATDARG